MSIEIVLRCHRSQAWPCVRVWSDGELMVDQCCDQEFTTITVDQPETAGRHEFVIEHYGKQDSDTICDDQGTIIADRAVEIESITIDGFEVPRNKLFQKRFYPVWPEHFAVEQQSEYIMNNNYLGFNGRFVFDYRMPMQTEYYGYYWDMEIEANRDFEIVDEQTKEEYFEAYNMRIRIDDEFAFTLTDLKNLIEQHEPASSKK